MTDPKPIPADLAASVPARLAQQVAHAADRHGVPAIVCLVIQLDHDGAPYAVGAIATTPDLLDDPARIGNALIDYASNAAPALIARGGEQ